MSKEAEWSVWPEEYKRYGYGGPKDEDYEKVLIFYGTDRKKTGEEKPNNYYGSHQADSVEYGTCEVSIPKKHASGEIERPGVLGLFIEDPSKHVVLLSIEPMQDSNFFSALREKINKSTEKDAFIFVHGYCVTFAEAARRTAQLAYDLGFNGAPVMYSWPSNEEYKRYDGDLEKVRYTVKNFERFLNQIVSNTQAQNIHLIAHSLGNVALTEALKSIGQGTKKPMFNQVILAAPDIDARIFKQDIVPAIGTAKRITLYASSADRALSLSRKFLKNPEILRAGESGDGMVVLDGIDTVDVSQINTGLLGLGHSYFAETMSLINDIFHLLRNDLSPDKRNLRPKEKNNIQYWSFPKTK
jgi:esterase/lipase superfamily enzyme